MKIEMDKQIKKTQIYYNGISKGYKTLYWGEQILKIDLVKNYFPQSGIILDLGSADGVLNKFISKKIKLISADLSFELLKLNSNKTSQNSQFSEGLGISNSLNKICANAQKLPFKNNSFDMIFAFTIIQDIPNDKISIVIKEIKRVLKLNSKLIISFIKISKKAELIEKELKKNFKIIETIEEIKDLIYILEKN